MRAFISASARDKLNVLANARCPPRRTPRRVRDPPRVGPPVAAAGSVAHSVRSQICRPVRKGGRPRDAAKRAPRAGAAGAAGAAAALAKLNVNAGGDWKTQAEDPYVGPGGYKLADIALLATSYIGCQSTHGTTIQSAVDDVPGPTPRRYFKRSESRS